jgi:hypothetical protein
LGRGNKKNIGGGWILLKYLICMDGNFIMIHFVKLIHANKIFFKQLKHVSIKKINFCSIAVKIPTVFPHSLAHFTAQTTGFWPSSTDHKLYLGSEALRRLVCQFWKMSLIFWPFGKKFLSFVFCYFFVCTIHTVEAFTFWSPHLEHYEIWHSCLKQIFLLL